MAKHVTEMMTSVEACHLETFAGKRKKNGKRGLFWMGRIGSELCFGFLFFILLFWFGLFVF